MAVLLKSFTTDQLSDHLSPIGLNPRMIRHLQASVIRRNDYPPASPNGLSLTLLKKVREQTVIPRLDLVEKVVSRQDEFARYRFRGHAPGSFEAIRIPLLHTAAKKYVVCVSCQTGCALGCAFCVTGRLGSHRNLEAWEMVDQVCQIQADSPHPVRGVVFMGMGEPMLNYEAVIQAARILSEPCSLAIGGKAITISTAGLIDGIRRFTREGHPYRLVVSLTSADPITRRQLMPVEKSNPSRLLIDALREYHRATGQRVTLAWTMISGVNTREEDARLLAELTRGLPIKLDLIDVNDPTGQFNPPPPDELNRFRDALRKHLGMPVARRYSGGRDIDAACGLLSGGNLSNHS